MMSLSRLVHQVLKNEPPSPPAMEPQQRTVVVQPPPRPTRGDVDEAAAFNARFIEQLPQRPWLRDIRIAIEQNACLACRCAPRSVARAELPALPHRRCTRQYGCACWYEAAG